ncbi:hypothetical protein HJC23_004706 [Cyclotella cryptica]|uniref:Uncharacterized protein n=1 Tax=Cyclotella cryptica TaxID=29204 RepID=A0ABD3PRZ2_9STRA|eukprot:CCRYP_012030-RA/>CCRYP_012030-RA protein AED:0.11 eAED:0.11 QI:0/-1/0/1/-1/1/1/0/395
MSAITIIDVKHASTDSSTDTPPKTPAPSPRTTHFHLLSLPPPDDDDDDSTTTPRDYLTLTNRIQPHSHQIYELQTVRPHHGKYASYFVGSRIVSNPFLHVATRVDPLFFLLNHFHRASVGKTTNQWQPLEQLLADVPHVVLRALNIPPNLDVRNVSEVGQLGHLLDVSDVFGDDIVCRWSEVRAMRWLRAKYDRCVEAVRLRSVEKKRRRIAARKSAGGGFGAFSSSFVVADEKTDGSETSASEIGVKESEDHDNPSLSKEEEHAARIGALQLMCDYLPSPWRTKLANAVGLSEEDWRGKTIARGSCTPTNEDDECSPGQKRPRASWEGALGQAEADEMLCLTTGRTAGEGSSVITPIEKNSVTNAQSAGLKRLAKVNTKGMKSLTSFFGVGKKK